MAHLDKSGNTPSIALSGMFMHIAIAALASLWFMGRKLPEPLVVAVASVLAILLFPLTHA